MSTTVKLAMLLLVVVCLSSVALAGDESAKGDEAKAQATGIQGSITVLAGCLGAVICAVGGGFAISRLASTCIESMARQPEASGSMFLPMIIAAGMIEGAVLFAILVCMMALNA